MTQYYIHVKNEQLGPFNYEELKIQKITKETKVWFEGLDEWTNASEIEPLKPLLISIPPPINSNSFQQPPKIENNRKVDKLINEVDETKVFGINKKVLYSVLGIVFLVTSFTYFYNLEDKNHEILIEKNKQTELFNQQQKELEEQNTRLAEQEKREERRRLKEKKENIEKRMNEITEQLSVNYQALEIANQNLKNVSSFQLLRSSSERNEQINSALNNIDFIKNEIKNLETEMEKISPNYGSSN